MLFCNSQQNSGISNLFLHCNISSTYFCFEADGNDHEFRIHDFDFWIHDISSVFMLLS